MTRPSTLADWQHDTWTRSDRASMTLAEALIASHIARHGVTRCPAAIAAPCSAELTQADIAAHHARTPVIEMASRDPRQWQPKAENRRGNRR